MNTSNLLDKWSDNLLSQEEAKVILGGLAADGCGFGQYKYTCTVKYTVNNDYFDDSGTVCASSRMAAIESSYLANMDIGWDSDQLDVSCR
jgi:hypothetical protein